ncbi:MAG: DUF4172 domain-containing protein [Brachymonas sp.]|nr:DUF4172 domain-containing protein [Brachymonas sp.]
MPIWQHSAWPAFTWGNLVIQSALDEAAQAQAELELAMQSIGFDGVQGINRDLWSQDALATAAIEGQNLDAQAVRSSVGHRLGLNVPPGADRDVEGLVQVMQEATAQYTKSLSHAQLCAWQQMIFQITRPNHGSCKFKWVAIARMKNRCKLSAEQWGKRWCITQLRHRAKCKRA